MDDDATRDALRKAAKAFKNLGDFYTKDPFWESSPFGKHFYEAAKGFANASGENRAKPSRKALKARIAELEKALAPFAHVADADISCFRGDYDEFIPDNENNIAPPIRIIDLRNALYAYRQRGPSAASVQNRTT